MAQVPDAPPSVQALLAPGGVRLETTGRRTDVILSAPQRRNAQTPATWRALAAVGEWAGKVADVVVLRGEGASFSSGLDRRAFLPGGLPGEPGLHELATLPDAELDAVIAGFQAGFACWSEGDFVSIAAVHGHAVGAGFQLALACDLRVVADDALMAMRETSLGLVPDLAGTHPLVRQVGYARALEICVSGRSIDAGEAVRLGLALSAAPAGRLAEHVSALADAVLAAPPGAVRETKRVLRAAVDRPAPEQRAVERQAQGRRLRDLLAAAGTASGT